MKTAQSSIINISNVGELINNGGVVILPFDTVYGFACDPRNEKALLKIFKFKKRPISKTIGLAVLDTSQLLTIAELSERQTDFIASKTPGRYTFIVKAKKNTNLSSYCLQNCTIGVRIPDSDFILDIIKEFGGIIAQTSANISGKPNCYSLKDLKAQYSSKQLDKVGLIIDGGEIENRGASQIFDLTGTEPKILERN